MICAKQLYNFIDQIMPFDTQEKWDNSGVIINSSKTTDKLLVCLDVTTQAVEYALQNNCGIILSHHPLIFSAINSIENNDVVYKAIKNDITVISAHTNYDKYNVGTCYHLAKLCGLDNFVPDQDMGVIAQLEEKTSLQDLLNQIKQKVKTPIQYTNSNNEVDKVFVLAGSAKGTLEQVIKNGCQCVVTGELSYHDILNFKHYGISCICLGHDISENISVAPLADLIKENFKDVTVFTFTDRPIINII